MNDLIAYLLGWKRAAKQGDAYFNPPKPKPKRPPEKPKKPKKPVKPVYPEGASEAEKLRIAQEKLRAQRETLGPAKPSKQPKSWYRKRLYDLFR